MPAIAINFDAAATLYKKKVLLRRRSDMKAGLTELPSFSWRMEKRHAPNVTDKDMVRSWMRYCSWALVHMAAGTSTTAFVALIKAGSDGAFFNFRLSCPHQQMLDPLADRSQVMKVMEEAHEFDLDVRYKFALTDGLCPVVFVYDRAARQVLVTNENHLHAPLQFLDIDRVGTTSGLLNFIGTMSMMEAMDPESAHPSRLQQLMHDAMSARRDEWLRWLYHLLETQALFESRRILVDPRNPEAYCYDYSGQ